MHLNRKRGDGFGRRAIERAAAIALVIASALPASAAVSRQASIQIIAGGGDPAPTIPNAAISDTYDPAINSAGDVVFRAALSGPGVDATNNLAVFRRAGGVTTPLLRSGQVVSTPTGDVAVGAWVYEPILTEEGNVLVSGRLVTPPTPTGISRNAIWYAPAGVTVPQLIASQLAPAPGMGTGVVFNNLYAARSAGGGRVTIRAQLAGAGVTDANDDILYWGVPGNWQTLREGAPAPGYGAGVVALAAGSLASPAGAVIIGGRVSGTGITTANDEAIWVADSTGIRRVVREGQAMPGFNGTLGGTSGIQVAMNRGGTVVVVGQVRGEPVGSPYGLWTGTEGNLRLLARTGNPAPQAPAGVTFGPLRDATIGRNGHVLVDASLAGPVTTDVDDSGLWVASPDVGGGLTRVARAGDAAPGLTSVAFGMPTNRSGTHPFFDAVVNGNGQVAFNGYLVTAGTRNDAGQGIWATDPFGKLTLVAANQTPLPDGAGGIQTPASVMFRTSSSSGMGTHLDTGDAHSFNDASQLTFTTFGGGRFATYVARVGGAARMSDAPPTLGPAARNGYGVPTPLSSGATLRPNGNAGYALFDVDDAATGPVDIFLSFDATARGRAAVLEELLAGEAPFGYEVTALDDDADYDFRLAYADPASARYFFWNFENVPETHLEAIGWVPEPSTALLIAAGVLSLARRGHPSAPRVDD